MLAYGTSHTVLLSMCIFGFWAEQSSVFRSWQVFLNVSSITDYSGNELQPDFLDCLEPKSPVGKHMNCVHFWSFDVY